VSSHVHGVSGEVREEHQHNERHTKTNERRRNAQHTKHKRKTRRDGDTKGPVKPPITPSLPRRQAYASGDSRLSSWVRLRRAVSRASRGCCDNVTDTDPSDVVDADLLTRPPCRTPLCFSHSFDADMLSPYRAENRTS
jgi:hypothetical protein